MLAPAGEIEHMPPPWIEAGLDGIRFWREFSARHKIGFHHGGSLLIAHEEDRYVLDRFKNHLPKSLGWETISADQIETLEPALGKKFTGGLLLSCDAHLHPGSCMQALSGETKRLGAQYRHAAADEETLSGFDHIIDCRGMGASCHDPDLRGVKGETVFVRNPEFSLSRPVRLMHPRYPLYIVPREDHVFLIGATNIESEEGKRVSLRSAMELLSALYSLHKSFAEAEILEIAAGIRPAYPDNLPRIKTQDRIISCNGLFRHGFLLAPVLAECAADIAEARTNRYMSLLTRGQSHEHHTQRTKNGHKRRA